MTDLAPPPPRTLAERLWDADMRVGLILHLEGMTSCDGVDRDLIELITEEDEQLAAVIAEANDGRNPREVWEKYEAQAREEAKRDYPPDDEDLTAEERADLVREADRDQMRMARELYFEEFPRYVPPGFCVRAEIADRWKIKEDDMAVRVWWGAYHSKWFYGRTYDIALEAAIEWAEYEQQHPELRPDAS